MARVLRRLGAFIRDFGSGMHAGHGIRHGVRPAPGRKDSS